jgi:hypothetical protein
MDGAFQKVLNIPDYSLVSGIACPGALPCASWSLFHTFQVNLARRPARCPLLKRLGHDIEFRFLRKIVLGVTKNLYMILDFQDVYLMSYCSCHFPSG